MPAARKTMPPPIIQAIIKYAFKSKNAKRGGRPHSLKFAWCAFCSFYLFCCKYASALLHIWSNTLLNTAISSCEMPASACFANSF